MSRVRDVVSIQWRRENDAFSHYDSNAISAPRGSTQSAPRDCDRSVGRRPARIEGPVRHQFDQLLSRHAIVKRLAQMKFQLIGAIQHHFGRHHARMLEQLLELAALIGDTSNGRNSPAESVVGTAICRTEASLQEDGRLRLPSDSRTGRIAFSACVSRVSLARHSATALPASVTEPPPNVTIRSTPASRATAVASTTAWRGE